ncbi:MAG: mannose-phosphate guanylyltransferase / phosphomannomutase [Clostridia bacterium]|nr:mannose-phosphate guanylyltransferase / phosphomannomutase [Clostridia bacterium]
MKAVIMAGGEGSRLRPLTCKRPKPLVPIANRPVMEYCVELLRQHNIRDIAVTLQYLPGLIEEYFGDGTDFGVRLHYFIEETPLGTAGSVKNAAPFLDETFVVISGDALTDFDLSSVLAWHREKGALATLVLTTVDNPLEYGIVITNPDGSIRSFLEKPSWGEVFSDRVNTGIYVLEPEILEYIPEGKAFDFSKDLFPLLLKQGRPLFGLVLDGYWCDVGNLTQYRQAHIDILSGRVKVSLIGEDRGNGIVAGEGAEIDPAAEIEGPVLLGGYCRLGPGCKIGPYTVLGPFTQVEGGASLKRAVLWDNVYIGRGASLRGSVVCSRAAVLAGARLYEGAVIGDGSRVMERAEVRPEVKIWPEKCLGQDTVTSESLIWGPGAVRNLFTASSVPLKLNGEAVPALLSRLGQAYGATFKPGAGIAVSAFSGGAGEMLKNALIAGLQAAGIRPADLGDILLPVCRYAVRANDFAGGCRIQEDAGGGGKVCLRLFNEKGADWPPSALRKMENLFWREDGRLAPASEMQSVHYLPAMAEAYREYLLRQVEMDNLARRRWRVALACQGAKAAGLGESLLARAGCDVIRLDPAPGRSWSEIQADLPFLSDEIRRYAADLGVVIDLNGEEFILLDERGFKLSQAQAQALLTAAYLEKERGGGVTLPVAAPYLSELVASRAGRPLRRTKNHPGLWQESLLKEESPQALTQFVIYTDALAAVLYLLDWLSWRGQTLTGALADLPRVYAASRSVPCPWEAKGRVVRILAETEPAESVELLDGIQVKHGRGRALILPDQEEPFYRIHAEAFSQEAAEELAGFYERRVKEVLLTELK